MTFAIFQHSGKHFVSSDKLKSIHNGFEMVWDVAFSNLLPIWSGPVAFSDFKMFMISSTPCYVIDNISKIS